MKIRFGIALAAAHAIGVAAACAVSGAAVAAEVRVIAPNAAREAVLAAVAAFEQGSGHKASLSWTGSEAITKRVGEGEVFDVVVNAAPNIERLTGEGRLAAETRTDFARSSVGVAAAATAARPDVSSSDSLKDALLGARSVAISSGPSGRHLEELFRRLGIAEQVKGKLRQPPSGTQISDLIASGEAELGFQQVSELMHVKGIQYLGPLPPELQSYTIWSAAAHSQAAQPDAARALIKRLREAETVAVVTKSGMEPLQANGR